jgi:hypothetical protein
MRGMEKWRVLTTFFPRRELLTFYRDLLVLDIDLGLYSMNITSEKITLHQCSATFFTRGTP